MLNFLAKYVRCISDDKDKETFHLELLESDWIRWLKRCEKAHIWLGGNLLPIWCAKVISTVEA